jgi:FixJ family two-component response regulator
VIFVVDDDPSVRRGLRRLLASAGYDVRVFASGDDLLADPGAAAAEPACFVLDVRMPGRNGLAVHEALLAAGHRCPVIFITGDGEIPESSRGPESAGLTVLAKPVDDGDLLGTIERLLGQAAPARDVGPAPARR